MSDKVSKEQGGNLATSGNDFNEFAEIYQKLPEGRKAIVHWLMFRYLAYQAVKSPNLTNIQIAFSTLYELVLPFWMPFIVEGGLVLAALFVWAWAMSVPSPFLWLACLCLAAAAIIKRPDWKALYEP